MKVYLDTSVISARLDERNPERRLLTEAFFREASRFEVYVAELTVAEIMRTPDATLRDRMKETLPFFSILPLTDEVETLAKEYIRHGAVPESYPEDAYHIAMAVANGLDVLLSWNFKHIVRRKTRDIVRMVNTLNGFRQIEIMTPAELL